jgi:hypothetical protein
VIQDEHEGAAKKGLAVLTEMWRRHVWRDARTVNVIAAATQHRSSRIMLAALKFFLGQDAEEAKGEGEPRGGGGARRRPPPAVARDSSDGFHGLLHRVDTRAGSGGRHGPRRAANTVAGGLAGTLR